MSAIRDVLLEKVAKMNVHSSMCGHQYTDRPAKIFSLGVQLNASCVLTLFFPSSLV